MVHTLDATLAALADPTRRHVVDPLCDRPRRAGELAADCAMGNPAMSRYLQVLRASGLVELAAEPADQDAHVRVYRLRSEPFVALQAVWTYRMHHLGGSIDDRRCA